MSARLLKKVLKDQEHKKQHEIEEEEDQQLNGDEWESPDFGARSSKNPFDLLNEGDDGDEDNADQVHVRDVDNETLTRKQERRSLKITSNSVSQSNYKSKKKKKNKSKEGSSSSDKHETPLDVTLDTLSLDVSSSGHQSGPDKPTSENTKVHGDLVKQSRPSILQVDPKYLNVENELRRIFGSKVVRSFEKSNQSSSSRQVRGGRRGSHHIRKTVLISPSDHWPRWDGSLSMEFLKTKDGYHYFRYAHSSPYEQAQRAFEAAQAIHDLNGVASVLLYHPYHLDSLITMADYFKFVGEHQMSADAIAKCLYALECAWHPMFTPLQGNCQLNFSHDTNKPLFKALFSHMKNMDRRGCHRSALEVCKLLLALDSDDPTGAMFCLDYFALRAGEYAWLERFSEDYRSDSSLWLFPNFSYSLAVCRFYLEQEESSHNNCLDSTKASSADLMSQALLLHPSVLKKLVAKVPLKDQAWTTILKNPFFRSDQIGIPSLDHLINIYVERNYLIWRLPDLQKLLRNGALHVTETLEHNKSDAKDWACVRKEAFSSDKNEYVHLLVQDFSDTVQTLPPDNLQNFMFDMREGAHIGGQVANGPAGGHAVTPRDVANRNPLAVLFESLLPWVNYGAAGDGLVDENEQGQDNED
ncbi:hypothetical protein DITRI_Ditri13aG0056900 [Diplodiscus trichospermus]